VVSPGSFVNFLISQGPTPVPVPSVVGQTQAAAGDTLVAALLALGSVATANDAVVPAGQVIAQYPAAGLTARPGSGVNIMLSLGPVMVTVPNVVGTSQSPAQTAVVGAGLAVGTLSLGYSAVIAPGSIISQAPAAGAVIPLGSTVNLVISQGPAPLAVPNVVGQTEAAATSALLGASLTVGTISRANNSTVPEGTVMGQGPLAGAAVLPGTAVNLLVSRGPVMVVVPDVVGAAQTTATSTLLAASLSYYSHLRAEHHGVGKPGDQPDAVARQQRAAGLIRHLIVSTGPTSAVVPNVVGLQQSAAARQSPTPG
jgi:beta-lactam-binding protein with PASTA domain